MEREFDREEVKSQIADGAEDVLLTGFTLGDQPGYVPYQPHYRRHVSIGL
jgi:hypothetical protein